MPSDIPFFCGNNDFYDICTYSPFVYIHVDYDTCGKSHLNIFACIPHLSHVTYMTTLVLNHVTNTNNSSLSLVTNVINVV